MAAPPAPISTKQRKKPGPKPKPKARQSLIVKLKINAAKLSVLKTFPPSSADTVGGNTSVGSSPSGNSPQPSLIGTDALTVQAGQKRRGIPGPKPGTKRGRQPGAPPSKPGRKKTKLDPNAPPGVLLNTIGHGVKLGPKGNTGAINEKLRALDRTGRPCKRWSKAGITLKSFTGVQWSLPTWAKPSTQGVLSIGIDGSQTISAEPSVDTGTPPIQSDIRSTSTMFPDTELPAINI
ncbi:INO80 complex subunit Ies4-domain-containing protein [Geopyxis carbonaria]|nr:INO80 complex subunit Ies4-domain-containing protein [Geopyxis carbonaria]